MLAETKGKGAIDSGSTWSRAASELSGAHIERTVLYCTGAVLIRASKHSLERNPPGRGIAAVPFFFFLFFRKIAAVPWEFSEARTRRLPKVRLNMNVNTFTP
jgi:hypothetical protein